MSWAIAGGAGGLISTLGGLFMQQRQYDLNVSLWKKQNAYNHPAEQMKRFAEAGLGPKAMLMSGGNMGSQPSPVSQAGVGDFVGGIEQGFHVKVMNEQAKLLEIERRTREHDLKLFERKGVPSTSPWWVKSAAGIGKKEIIDFIQKMGNDEKQLKDLLEQHKGTIPFWKRSFKHQLGGSEYERE